MRKKKRENKVLTKIENMSDEEFIKHYKKYYIGSGSSIVGGILLVIAGIAIIILFV